MNELTIKHIVLLAAPTAASAMLNNAFRVIDQHAVQWLGVQAQAAVASCTFVLIGYFAVYAIVSAGTIPCVSRAVGASDPGRQRKLVGNALAGAAVLGLIVLTLSGMAAPVTVRLLGLEGETAAAAQTYLRWHAATCFAQTLAPTIDAVFIALGRTGLVLVLQTLATLLNLILNPVFIYWAGLGIGGAALATGMSQAVSVAVGLGLIAGIVAPRRQDFLFDVSIRRIARIGLPVCWGTLMFAGVYWALISLVVSPLGPSVNAALGIGFSALEGFTWPVFWGFSMAVASLIGRCIGAGRPDLARRTIRLVFPLMTAGGLLAALVFWFGAYPLCGLFTEDRAVLEQAVLYARILAFSQLFVAYEALAEGVLEGAGATRAILLWSAPFNLLRVPLAWVLAIHLGWGAGAIWWVINATTLIKAAGKGYVVARGRWQTTSVL